MTAFTFYNKFKENMVDASSTVAFGTNTIKLALVTVSYSPAGTDEFWSTPQANEVSGTNYTAGGTASASTVSGGTTTTTKVVQANVTWLQDAAGFSNARFGILYRDTGTAATSPLIGRIDFGADKGNVNGDLSIVFDAGNGAFTLT
jgi:hypothetical protein